MRIPYSKPLCARCHRPVAELQTQLRPNLVVFTVRCHGARESVSFTPQSIRDVVRLIGTVAFVADGITEPVDVSC